MSKVTSGMFVPLTMNSAPNQPNEIGHPSREHILVVLAFCGMRVCAALRKWRGAFNGSVPIPKSGVPTRSAASLPPTCRGSRAWILDNSSKPVHRTSDVERMLDRNETHARLQVQVVQLAAGRKTKNPGNERIRQGASYSFYLFENCMLAVLER